MPERIKTLLKELYPASNPSEGVDFDKSGTVEKGEAVKDFDGNGTIDDVDYGIFTFNNRNSFIYHNGLNRWREVEKYWDDAAKKAGHVVAKSEPAISANNNAGDEALQNRIVNDEFGGGANELNEKQAENVVETQRTMEEIHRRYPSMKKEDIRPSDAKRILAMMKEVEEFNPKLVENIDKVVYNVEGCGEHNSLMAECAVGNSIHINSMNKAIPIYEKEFFVHEATHVYHDIVKEEDGLKQSRVRSELKKYVNKNYPICREYKSKSNDKIDGRCRDIIEENLLKRGSGRPYDIKLVELYEKWNSVRENSFNYQWNHVNQRYMQDGDYKEVFATGKKLEHAEDEFEVMVKEAFGKEGNDPFWHDSFYEGGDKSRPVVSGRTEFLIRNCPDAAMKKKLEDKKNELDTAVQEYKNALNERQLSRTIQMTWPDPIALTWKGFPIAGPAEGLSGPQGVTTNNEEAVATFVEYVYANGKLPYKRGETRHNEMVKNYARLLRDHGFIRKDHPAVASL